MKWLYRLIAVGLLLLGLTVGAFGVGLPTYRVLFQRSSYRARAELDPADRNWYGGPRELDRVGVDLRALGLASGFVTYADLHRTFGEVEPDWPRFGMPLVAFGQTGEAGGGTRVQLGGRVLAGSPVGDAGTVVSLPAGWVGGTLAAVGLLMLLAALIRRLIWRETRLRSNTCLHCGHLLIDVDSDECPQCGAVRPLVTVSSTR